MTLLSPENQWPPPLENPKGGPIAWKIVHTQTRNLLLETVKGHRKSTVKRATSPQHLLLQITETEHEQKPFSIAHGLFNPKSELHSPVFVCPQTHSLELLNNLDELDAQQIASRLTYDYLYDRWITTKLLSQDEEDDIAFELAPEFDELSDYMEQEENDDEEDEECINFKDPEFLACFEEQHDLRRLYQAIVLGQLSPDNVFIAR